MTTQPKSKAQQVKEALVMVANANPENFADRYAFHFLAVTASDESLEHLARLLKG